MVRYYKNGDIGIIEFNDPDSKVNLLSVANLDELGRIIDHIVEEDRFIKALFFVSGKKDTFIAGADIKELANIRTREEVIQLCAKGQDLFNKIECLSMPTFALVDGACIGGGLELALSCKCILATKNKKVKFGLPEKKLGIRPGFSGFRRLAKRAGKIKAENLVSAGNLVNSEEARRLNIVDRVIPESEKIPYQKLMKTYRHRCSGAKDFSSLEDRERVELDRLETDLLAEEMLQESARNSFSSFLLASKYKNFKWLEPMAEDALPIERCAIIGAGAMGRGIAYLVNSELGLQVGLREVNRSTLKKAKLDIKNIYKDAVKRAILCKDEAELRFRNMSFGHASLIDRDLVIESVTEDAFIKKAVFAEIERELPKECILATNTSCLSVEELAKPLKHSERFLGIHFFNPAYKMKLVEVVPTRFTSCTVLQTVIDFLQHLRRIPIIVKDNPGFLVNRMLLPYLNEAIFMLEEGVSAEDIDKTMLEFGIPMGPLQLLEEIGLDVAYKASKILEQSFGERFRAATGIKEIKKYRSCRACPAKTSQHILERLLHPMRREAELCLEEGLVASREVIDLALLLGIGFPPSKRIW